MTERLGIPDDFEVYRVDVPYPKEWPAEQVRAHLALVLREQAERVASIKVPTYENPLSSIDKGGNEDHDD